MLMRKTKDKPKAWFNGAWSRIGRTIIALAVVAVAGCGGSSGGGGGAPPPSQIVPIPFVIGVAAVGAPIVGTATLKDAAGTARVASTSATGAFSIDVTGLAPPFFLKATNSQGTVTLYSIAAAPGVANINPLSHLIVMAVAMTIDPSVKNPSDVFFDPAKFKSISATLVEAATVNVMANMSSRFRDLLSTQGSSSVNPIADRYEIGNGLDRTFDALALTLDPVTGTITERDTATGVVSTVATQANFRAIFSPAS